MNADGTASGVFTVSSTFFQINNIGITGGPPYLIDAQPTDTGIAQVTLQRTFDGRFLSTSVTYNFKPADQLAIPEPATKILLGTGLAGIASATRRRCKAGQM